MLEAKVLGFPKPDVRWFHDGNEVKPSGRLKFLFEDQESMTLVIKNVTSEDAGVYKIVAKNDLGEDSTELQLTVKGKLFLYFLGSGHYCLTIISFNSNLISFQLLPNSRGNSPRPTVCRVKFSN